MCKYADVQNLDWLGRELGLSLRVAVVVGYCSIFIWQGRNNINGKPYFISTCTYPSLLLAY